MVDISGGTAPNNTWLTGTATLAEVAKVGVRALKTTPAEVLSTAAPVDIVGTLATWLITDCETVCEPPEATFGDCPWDCTNVAEALTVTPNLRLGEIPVNATLEGEVIVDAPDLARG